MLRLGLGNLFAVAEAYPDLKANESFQHLQTRISGLEDAIADRREFYNASVNVNVPPAMCGRYLQVIDTITDDIQSRYGHGALQRGTSLKSQRTSSDKAKAQE